MTTSAVLPEIVFVTRHACFPACQNDLAALLASVFEEKNKTRPGFISASVHCSIDGTLVSNYEQWRSLDDYLSMQASVDCDGWRLQAEALSLGHEEELYEFPPSPVRPRSLQAHTA